MTRVGLMLYTVRDECARDLEGVLRKVGDLPFDGVEIYREQRSHSRAQREEVFEYAGLDSRDGQPAAIDRLRIGARGEQPEEKKEHQRSGGTQNTARRQTDAHH